MIFTASDVSSLSQSLHRWETAEYIFEGLVIIACAGELVADLGRKCLTKARRDRIERLSTILLVAALSMELICLVKTNDLSGRVIGSLSDKATDAEAKAKSAIEKSALAESKADRAVEKSQDASASASTALVFASGARREVESVARDIASTKQQTARLAEKVADRSLTEEQIKRIAGKLRPFAGQEYDVVAYWDSQESVGIAERINTALQLAQWKFIPLKEWHGLFGGVVGVLVWSHPDAEQPTKEAATSLVAALRAEGLKAEPKIQNPANNPKHNKISLSVGANR